MLGFMCENPVYMETKLNQPPAPASTYEHVYDMFDNPNCLAPDRQLDYMVPCNSQPVNNTASVWNASNYNILYSEELA